MYVEEPGLFTLVQDLGRWGYQSKGVTVSEPMDSFSLRLGNVMLGNDENAAALEMVMFGPVLVFRKSCCIAVTGADFGLTIDGEGASAWRVHRIEAGSRVALAGMTGDGCRAYLCIGGGIATPPVMGSRSTYVKAGIGGMCGRALQAGDILPLGEPAPNWQAGVGLVCPEEYRGTAFRDDPLYALDGPQVDAFSPEGLATFYNESYTVTDEIDRMGYRLDGPEIARLRGADIVSDGIAFGSVQVPGNGKPIVLMSDRQTTGGYTKIAVVSSWSVASLAQKMPGESVRFKRVTVEEATAMLRRFENTLHELRKALAARGAA
jgi:biotin-dependent carboxylase-like uncharacterized protein